MAAGSDTYINSMMEWAGLENAFKNKLRYPETTLEELKQLNPQVVMLSSEPYPFKSEHVQEIQAILTHSKVLLVDGEVFSWYGTRMVPAFLALPNIINNWI
jgi:ABC-type Fe3+-hydroxamate transport system substrate-binding protein